MTDAWDALGEKFVDGYYGSLRGRVRTFVIDAHLRDHLAPPPARVVDVGGGAGNQSIPLARSGYEVTIIDPSPAMLERAEAAIRLEPTEVARRITLVEASGDRAVAAVGGEHFGAVLCHGVVMYLDDPGPVLDQLARLAEPDALVSIVAKNAEVMAMRPGLAGEWETVLDAFDTTTEINGLGVMTRGDLVEDLSTRLTALGVDPIVWYGVRLFTDGWTRDRPSADAEELVIAAELEASRRDPYRHLSRLFHLLGRRRGEPTGRAASS